MTKPKQPAQTGRRLELYVDTARGNDQNDGSNWKKAQRTAAHAQTLVSELGDYDELVIHVKSQEAFELEPAGNVPMRAIVIVNAYPCDP